MKHLSRVPGASRRFRKFWASNSCYSQQKSDLESVLESIGHQIPVTANKKVAPAPPQDGSHLCTISLKTKENKTFIGPQMNIKGKQQLYR